VKGLGENVSSDGKPVDYYYARITKDIVSNVIFMAYMRISSLMQKTISPHV
jgi:hypothetical protein